MLGFILAQVFGAIALILVCIGYFVKQKTTFMFIQVVANIFYAGAFLVVGAFVGAGLVTISIFRCIYLFIAEKKQFKYTVHFLPIFIALYITTTILLWKSPLDLMPLTTSTLFTLAYAVKNMQIMRYILLVPNSMLVVYNILTTTYTSALLDFIEVIVIIIALIKFHNESKKRQV